MTHFKIKVRHIHLEVFLPDCGGGGGSQLKEAKNAKESSGSL